MNSRIVEGYFIQCDNCKGRGVLSPRIVLCSKCKGDGKIFVAERNRLTFSQKTARDFGIKLGAAVLLLAALFGFIIVWIK